MFFAVGHRVKRDVLTEPLAQNPFTRGHGPILTASGSGVVGMGVGDQGPGNRTPRIDPGLCGTAIQPLWCAFDQAPPPIAADSLKGSFLERVRPARHEAARCRSVCFSPGCAQFRFGSEKDSQGLGHNQCPLGYVNTLGTTCVSPIYYEMKPTNGEACPSGWMNVGAGYCRKK